MLRTLKNLFKQDREKFVVPKSVQNVIPIKTISEDGIFLVGRNKYAKTFKFEDMLNFGKLYDIISDEEKKNLITYLIKEIQIYPNGESEMPLKSIEFNFPIYRDGQEVRRLLWEKGNTVETVGLFTKQ